MTFKEFCAKHGITIEATPIDARTDGTDFAAKGNHYRYVLRRPNPRKSGETIAIHAGEFSKGIGYAEAWARKNQRAACIAMGRTWFDLLNLPPGRKVRDDSNYWGVLAKAAAKHIKPTAADVLECLAMDSASSDQPFADWAADYGYSDDSIKAKKAWESCNDTRRALQSGLGAAYDELLECEE